MKKIVAIGGGKLNVTTNKIDEYIISLSNKKKPKVLFIPLASGDFTPYIEKFTNYYSMLNCDVDTLKLTTTNNDILIKSKIFSSDIIYIGGGNTAKMMRIFKRSKVNEYLINAYEKGIVLAGLSAGAMAFFTNGYSDSNRSTNPNADYCLVKGLNIIPYCFCPHYNDKDREGFDSFVKSKNLNGLALEDNTALVYIDDKIDRIIKSDDNAKAYIINSEDKIQIK